MTEFRKKYQNFPVDFHLWSQDKIAELWWKLALEWALSTRGKDKYGQTVNNIQTNIIKDELEE